MVQVNDQHVLYLFKENGKSFSIENKIRKTMTEKFRVISWKYSVDVIISTGLLFWIDTLNANILSRNDSWRRFWTFFSVEKVSEARVSSVFFQRVIKHRSTNQSWCPSSKALPNWWILKRPFILQCRSGSHWTSNNQCMFYLILLKEYLHASFNKTYSGSTANYLT